MSSSLDRGTLWASDQVPVRRDWELGSGRQGGLLLSSKELHMSRLHWTLSPILEPEPGQPDLEGPRSELAAHRNGKAPDFLLCQDPVTRVRVSPEMGGC